MRSYGGTGSIGVLRLRDLRRAQIASLRMTILLGCGVWLGEELEVGVGEAGGFEEELEGLGAEVFGLEGGPGLVVDEAEAPAVGG